MSVFARNITGGRKILSRDFKEFIELLNSNDVRYLVIGSFAMALYGKPRYTKDIDIWLECNEANAKRVVKAVGEFGFSSLGLEIDDFVVPQIIQLGYPPNRIDLITSAAGVTFAECYSRAISYTLDGIEVTCINIEDLKANKRATARLQDLADIETLESAD